MFTAKFEEAEEKVPSFYEIGAYANSDYKADDIQEMESWVLSSLKWNLNTVTPPRYLGLFHSKGVVFESDTIQGRELVRKVPRYVKKYTDFFSDLCLQEYSFQQYPSSLLASAIIAASRRALHIKPLWCNELTYLTSYTETEIWDCFEHIWNFYVASFPKEAEERYKDDAYYTSPNTVMVA